MTAVVEEPGGDVVYGVLRLGGMDVALPLSALREVVPCPMELAGLPASAPGLLGALELRRLVLPVVDLRPVIGRPDERRPDQVVVVVAHDGQVLGLLADEVRGVTQLPSSLLVAARTQGERLLFSHTFRHPDTGRAHSVLDAEAVLNRPGVPTVDDVTRETAAVSDRTHGSGAVRMLTVVRCGEHRFAIDAAHVHTTLPTPDLRGSVLSGPMCPGVMTYAEREVPVVDPLALLGLGRLAREEIGAGLVVDVGTGYVVLALTALLELAEVPAADVLPLPAYAVARPDLVPGMVEVDGVGDCLVLAGDALLADPQVSGFASVNTAVAVTTDHRDDGATAAAVAVAAAAGAPSYLIFSLGVDVAVPLEQVVEILPFPASLTRTAVDGLLGTIVHRRTAVPVFCLATLLGREQRPPTATSCVLLVSVDGELAAFAVEVLRSIDPLTWQDESQQVRGSAGERGATLRTAPLVRVGTHDRLLPDLDLRAIARRAAAGRADPRTVELAPAG